MTRFRPRSIDPARQPAGRASPGQPLRAPSNRAQRPATPQPTPLQTILLWSAVSIAALAVATATFLFIAAPTDLVRDRIVQQVRDRTGRDLAVAGGTSLTIFPSLGVSLRNVSLSPPPGMTGEPMARVAAMDVSIPLWPLLRGRLEVEQLVLRRPELDLRIDAEGRRNWVFRRPGAASVGPSRGAGGAAAGNELAMLQDLALGDVRIEDGAVRYLDEQRDVREEITGLDLRIGLASLTSPLEARGNLVLRDEKVDVSGRLDSLATLLAGSPSRIELRLAGRPVEAVYEGTISTAPSTSLAGTLTARSESLRGLAAWIGAPLPVEDGSKPMTFTGRLETAARSVALTGVDLRLGGSTVKGGAVLETRAGARPHLSADLQLSELDLTGWLAAEGRRPVERSRGDARPGSGGKAPARTIDDLLEGNDTGQPQVRGFIARHGWSDVPIDLAPLGLVDADVKLLVGRLVYRDVKAGRARVTARLIDRVLDASFEEMQLYQGSGRGAVRLDATGPSASLEANLQLEEVSAFELLRDASEFDWISGRGRISLALKGQGRSEREIVQTLDGKAEVTLRNGALVGFDIPALIGGLQQGRIPQLERNGSDKTEFSEAAASFTIENGVAENRDLRLTSPLLRVTGAGTADLPRRTLDYTVRPKLLAAAGQPGAETPTGFELPVRITGSWDRPSFAADIDAVLQNPDQVVEAAKELGKRFKGKNLEETLRGLLGGGEGETGSGAKPKTRDLLRQLLKP
ncbi:MAG: AsmA family protein [Hyphomicrobiaceae bacterium]|nr:AsmA family protein [Hyphomicrobiaceae bacterium]